MKAPGIRATLGAFRILRRRCAEVGQPALSVWTDAGEEAARQASASIARKAHASETCDREAERELVAGLAGLADGRVDTADLDHFRRAGRLVNKSAELDHDISEIAAT